ncbi:hypothetical protein ACTPOK_20185 [Streptomyces inhibens]|uniref:hypothetical protein n=1 Tax=Streptomyces inhibens TaxID=2293571 RepID=UPI00402AFE2A
MEAEVTAAWISALGALGGVAFGTVASIVAARIQAKPAHQAAEAAHAQAEAAYRAALDSAREQIKGAAAQNTSSARRQVYAAFISEAHKLQLAVAAFDRDFYGPTIDTGEARRALDRVEQAAALVFLEGPEEVTEAAWEVYNEGSSGLSDYEESSDVRGSWFTAIRAGHEEALRTTLEQIRYHVMQQVHACWMSTGKSWAVHTARDLDTPFPSVPTATFRNSPALEVRIGSSRLVQPPDGGDPVPYYETVKPSSELVMSLRASIESYLFACLPLIESGAMAAQETQGILRYALNAEHAPSPEIEFAHTAGDVANDLLKFVETAQRALKSRETG